MFVLVMGLFLAVADGGPATESYKNQYCTDPRTMRKHAAYTEWADAYSCTRHRCQPGGRNLAIYTVGCKRVEAPESAIECEEVVEDTNMQFPFCCTRLRCLVVVRGEVWTRVLGQPWESLPAAPWSHMYKMKKPPPVDGTFAPKTAEQGPIYELTDSDSDGPREKVLRASKQVTTAIPDCNKPVLRAVPPPDIVIALSTNPDPKEKPLDMNMGSNGGGNSRHKRVHNEVLRANNYFEDEGDRDHLETDAGDMEDLAPTTEKAMEQASDERFYGNALGVTQKAQHHQSWTEIPQNQWNEHDPGIETDSNKDNPYNQQDFPEQKTDLEKPSNLQALVDAIGSRMRDIENVVQRMSEKVHPGDENGEKGDVAAEETFHKRHKSSGDVKEFGKTKRPGNEDHYKRFSVRNRSKYLHASDSTTDKPLFIEDTNMNGYFSDASNTVLRRSNAPKEPVQTYMAPVETRRKANRPVDFSEEKKRKKHQHKKKKGKHHKKHHNKKRFNRLSSAEVDKNVVSLEDSSAVGT